MTPPALRSTPLTASLPCLPSWSSSKARPGRSARFRSIPSQRREEPIRHHRGCRGTHLHVSGRRGSGIARRVGEGSGDALEITARTAAAVEAEAASVAPEARLVEYAREVICDVVTDVLTTPLNGPCATNVGAVEIPDCEGQPPVLPLWRRTRTTPAGPWSAWENSLRWTCTEDAMPERALTDVRRLPIAPPPLTIQPARPQVLVNLPTIV